MSTYNRCGCTSKDCRVNGCLMKRQRKEAGGFYAADSADCGCSTRSGGSMTTKNTGGPAFPFGQISEVTGQPVNGFYDPGMSLRDAMALSVRLPDDYSAKWGEALIGEQRPNDVEPVGVHIDWWMRVEAAYRYRMADAMLKAREEE